MFTLAIAIGIYSYLLFFFGIVGLLYQPIVILVTVGFFGGLLIWKKKLLINQFSNILSFPRRRESTRSPIKSGMTVFYILIFVFVLQIIVNLIGVLAPEFAFDALWYHLTLPKIWLEQQSISFIPGGLLYYSAMPKLAEILYVGALSFGTAVVAKGIHFSFGLLTCFAIYFFSRRFFTPLISLIAVVIFYSNIVVAWESTTAYIDLVRAFFEILALWAFIEWRGGIINKWFILSAVMIGFAITTKLLAIGSLIIFTVLFFYILSFRATERSRGISHTNDSLLQRSFDFANASLRMTKNIVLYWVIALLIPLPWFVFSYLHTGNPVYPFFTDLYPVAPVSFSFFGFFTEVWKLFTQAADPVSPIYLIVLPLMIWVLFKGPHPSPLLKGEGRKKGIFKLLSIYSFLAVIIWYVTPRTGGGRFIVPYLPAMSILCAAVISSLLQQQKMIGRLLIGLVMFLSLVTIAYRSLASIKYLPVVLGRESKQEFLTNHLNFSFGDFYDTDGYFKKHITKKDTVLLYGFHNLYYIDFSYIHETWVKKGDSFNYIATQNTELPQQYKEWKLVYENTQTMVKLYKREGLGDRL